MQDTNLLLINRVLKLREPQYLVEKQVALGEIILDLAKVTTLIFQKWDWKSE